MPRPSRVRPGLQALLSLSFACHASSSDGGDTGTDGGTSVTTTASTGGEVDSTASDDPSVTTSNPTSVTSMTSSADSTDASSGGESTAADDTASVDPDAIAVAVGYGTRRVRSVDGLTWTDFVEVNPDGGDDDDNLRGVGYGNGVFLAVGGGGQGFSMRSTDGITWTDETMAPGGFLSDVVVLDDGTFVAAGGNGLRTRSLDEGVTWVDATEYYAGHYRAIAAGNGIAVAVGHTYGDTNDGLISTTADGATWTAEQIVGAPYSGLSITFGHGTFVTLDGAGQIRASADGMTWSDADHQAPGDHRPIVADGAFWIGGDDSYWSSDDGLHWVAQPGEQRNPVAWFHGQFLALGWPASISASADLSAWQTVFEPGGSGLNDIALGVPGT